jgi:hypothetical protein
MESLQTPQGRRPGYVPAAFSFVHLTMADDTAYIAYFIGIVGGRRL